MSNEGQSQPGVQAQPQIELLRVEDIQRLTTLDGPTKAKLLPAFQQLWNALETKPPESIEYKTAHARITEWSQKLRGNLLQRKAQAQAQNQASQQGAGRSLQQQQQQQAQQAQQARPQNPTQALGQQQRPQNMAQQQPQQLQIPQHLRQHVESLQIILHPSIPQGTPEAEKQLNDMKQSYLLALTKMEQAKNAVTRLKEAMEKAKAHGEDVSAMQTKINSLVQVHNGSKQFAEDFRKKQVAWKAQANQQQQQQQTSQSQPQQPQPSSQQPQRQSQPQQAQQQQPQQQLQSQQQQAQQPQSQQPPQLQQQQQQQQQQPQPQQSHQQQQQQQQQSPQSQQPGPQIKVEGGSQSFSQPASQTQVPTTAPSISTPHLQSRGPPGQPAPLNSTSTQQASSVQSPTVPPQVQQGPGAPQIQIQKQPNLNLARPQIPPQHIQQSHLGPQLQSPSTAQNPAGAPVPLSHQAAISAAAQSYSTQQQTQSQVASTPTQGYYAGNREQPTMNNPKMPIPKQLNIPPPQAVSMGPARPTMGNGAPGMIGQPVINKMATFQLEGDSDRVLSKKKLDELVRQVIGGEGVMLTPEVEEIMLQLADEFVDNVTTAACRLSRLRDSATLDIRDIQLVLERNYNMRIPGYASDDIRTVRKVQPAPGWTQKMNAVQAAKVMGGKADL